MNVSEARKLLTHRHSRIHDASGMVYIGLSTEDAEAIAALLPAGDPPATVPATEAVETPTVVEPTEPEKVVDTESGPVKVPRKKTQKKAAKKKTKKRRKG